ncbi:hypothetical protein [Pseudoalteromonas sp. Of7M-16]|uniref:hypothetical protein n=1 Tax=Pseudoalteromonas sp. Of7M-16 TaxID=2917756 RepID=UPI001EF6E311|nr:hypothetical protein [Pseudoalteromonas sp. Of7M-16]MCG7551595.1 hypothetical protein [Pseudoalteromonas sp. Of7M-16]
MSIFYILGITFFLGVIFIVTKYLSEIRCIKSAYKKAKHMQTRAKNDDERVLAEDRCLVLQVMLNSYSIKNLFGLSSKRVC